MVGGGGDWQERGGFEGGLIPPSAHYDIPQALHTSAQVGFMDSKQFLVVLIRKKSVCKNNVFAKFQAESMVKIL